MTFLRTIGLPSACAWLLACSSSGGSPAAVDTKTTDPTNTATHDHAAHDHAAHDHAAAAPEEHGEHCAHHPEMKAGDALPGASLYNLAASLTDQEGTALDLKSFRGEPLLVTMFYASCTSVCPMLIGHVQRVEAAIAESSRSKVRVLLVSLDPEHDSVENLSKLADQHGVDRKRWHFARTTEASMQEIAALLGVRYRRMPDGEISHSPTIALLDTDGVIAARVDAPLGEPAVLVEPLLKLLNATVMPSSVAPSPVAD